MAALVLEPRRHDVPSGAVPEYRKFVRHLWAWRAEDGRPCVTEPPWMYSMLVHDPAEVSVTSAILGTLYQIDTIEGRFEIIMMDDGAEFSFSDLAALHAFLRAAAALGATNETARHVCECIMWSVGFRWV